MEMIVLQVWLSVYAPVLQHLELCFVAVKCDLLFGGLLMKLNCLLN
jgi:hypothetical protein